MFRRILTLFVALLCGALPAAAQVQGFGDYQQFLLRSGPVSTIDFETQPNGTPAVAGVDITETFNYDAQGAHFTGRFPYPYLGGNDVHGFSLRVDHPTEDQWIIADLITPTHAVGAFFPADTQLCVYDAAGVELRCFFDPGLPGAESFFGFVSPTPIARARFYSGGRSEAINAFVFAPIPEPGAAGLLMLATLFARRLRPRMIGR